MSITDSTLNFTDADVDNNPYDIRYVRGVNIGGWLVLERYITPYLFAVTDCHLSGDMCWYPGQESAPPTSSPDYKLCDFYECKPERKFNPILNKLDFPIDEFTLGEAFPNKADAAKWLNYHFANFVKYEDIVALSDAGVTHVRVPLPHFILGDVEDGEPWIAGDRWKYFVRLCRWCRKLGIEVWPDIHTSPGSQNGFDNSGQTLPGASCLGWSGNPSHVDRLEIVLQNIMSQIVEEGIQDVVTGFGLLNEPFKDCDVNVYENYIDRGLEMVRDNIGDDTTIYVSDMFEAKSFNNGKWKWLGLNEATAQKYNNTYLDSHFYQVFAEEPRAFSPRQHIAYVCQNERRDFESCCYRDHPHNTKPARGVKRMVGEFSAACDALPVSKLNDIMDGIATNYSAPELDRKLHPNRQQFLQHYVHAQMVAYEAADVGIASAWFYWTLKMEGGAFAEWDFLRGLKEKWINHLPPPNVTSQSIYGSCYDVLFRTDDTPGVLHEFPNPRDIPPNMRQDVPIDDDVVITHGDSLLHGGRHNPFIRPIHHGHGMAAIFSWLLYTSIACFVVLVIRIFIKRRAAKKRSQYIPIEAQMSV